MTAAPQRVLIVDDEPGVRTCARLCLEEAGYVVEQAANGADALEQIEHDRPDMVLLDLAMPVIDGMTVLAELRSAPKLSTTRVVVITAHGSVKTAVDAMRLGAIDLLEKPFTPDELRHRVATVLTGAQRPRDPAADADAATAVLCPSDLASETGYRNALSIVRRQLAANRVGTADELLQQTSESNPDRAATDASFLNLVGIAHEARGYLARARTFYAKSISVSHAYGYAPAADNNWRVYDVAIDGRSTIDVSLGSDAELAEAFPEGAPSSPLSHLKSPRVIHDLER